jgi:hypothetical protein
MVSLVVLVYAVLRAGSALGMDGLNPNQGNSEPVITNQGTDHQRNTDQMIPNQRTDHQANADTMEDNWDGMISPTGRLTSVQLSFNPYLISYHTLRCFVIILLRYK